MFACRFSNLCSFSLTDLFANSGLEEELWGGVVEMFSEQSSVNLWLDFCPGSRVQVFGQGPGFRPGSRGGRKP